MQIKYDPCKYSVFKVSKLIYRFHFSTKFLTSAFKEAIYCTLAREMIVYSLRQIILS
jgi:hypothetical protein